jgi:hypothetical protein
VPSGFPSGSLSLGGWDGFSLRVFGLLGTEEMSRRKEQNCAEKGNQYPSCVRLRNHRDMSVSISIMIAPAVFVSLSPSLPVVVAFVAFTAIVVGIRQHGENQYGCA